MNPREKIIRQFWEAFAETDFDLAASYMSDDAIVVWSNTEEAFNRDDFISLQKKYPGEHQIILEKVISAESSTNIIISIVKVISKFNENEIKSFYAVSLFEFKDDMIIKITEYWGDISEPPDWRK